MDFSALACRELLLEKNLELGGYLGKLKSGVSKLQETRRQVAEMQVLLDEIFCVHSCATLRSLYNSFFKATIASSACTRASIASLVSTRSWYGHAQMDGKVHTCYVGESLNPLMDRF